MSENLTQAQRAALEAAVLDLDAAATPTSSDVFTACGVHAADLRDAIKAALQPQAGEPKPVAWRWRHTAKTYGHDCETPGPWHEGKPPPYFPSEAWRYEEQPLFAHPPKPDPDVVRLVEAALEMDCAFGRWTGKTARQEQAMSGLAAAIAPFSALGEG